MTARSSSSTLAAALALVGPFAAVAALGGWWNAASYAEHNAWDAGSFIAARTVWQEVARSVALSLAGGGVCLVLWLGVRFVARSGRATAAFVLLWFAQAAWLVPVLEAPESWRVARVRHGFAVPNLLWRVVNTRAESNLDALTGALAKPAVWPALALLALGLVVALAARRRELPGRLASRLGGGAALAALAVVAVARARLAAARPDPAPVARPVVFLTWDSTRADHLSCYGYERETTPSVDAFAAENVLFERAYSNHNWTRPSYMSTLTGIPGWELDMRGVRGRRTLVAEALKDAGYATRAFVQNPNLNFSFRMDQGFDRYLQFTEDARPAEVAAWVEAAIDELAGEPFFLFVHIEQPHWPYLRDGHWVADRDDDDAPVSKGLVEELLAFHRVEKWDAERPDADERLAYLLDLYDGDIRDADAAVGEILGHLRERGLYEESLILFFSDHGDEFFDRGNFGHAHPNVHQDVTRVPLVVRFPASLGVEPRRSDVPVQNLDLYPTVVDALGLAPVPELRGTSLLTLLGAAPPERTILSAYDGLVAVRTRDYALFRDFKRERGPVVYDVREDPGETVVVEDPSSVPAYAELVELAEWWSRECWPDAEDVPGAEGDVSPELRARLEELGYLGE